MHIDATFNIIGPGLVLSNPDRPCHQVGGFLGHQKSYRTWQLYCKQKNLGTLSIPMALVILNDNFSNGQGHYFQTLNCLCLQDSQCAETYTAIVTVRIVSSALDFSCLGLSHTKLCVWLCYPSKVISSPFSIAVRQDYKQESSVWPEQCQWALGVFPLKRVRPLQPAFLGRSRPAKLTLFPPYHPLPLGPAGKWVVYKAVGQLLEVLSCCVQVIPIPYFHTWGPRWSLSSTRTCGCTKSEYGLCGDDSLVMAIPWQLCCFDITSLTFVLIRGRAEWRDCGAERLSVCHHHGVAFL